MSPSTDQRIVHELATYSVTHTPPPTRPVRLLYWNPWGVLAFWALPVLDSLSGILQPMLHFPSQLGVSRLASLPVGEQTQLWFRNKPGPWTGLWRGLSGGQSCGTEPITCGIWGCLQVGSIWIELNCRTHSWCQRIAWCGKNPHIWQPEVFCVHCGCSVTQSHLTLCDRMGLQHARHPCPSLSQYLPGFVQTHLHCVSDAIQSSHPVSPLLLLPSIFPSIRVFSSMSALHIKWPKYWSFSSASVLPVNIQG